MLNSRVLPNKQINSFEHQFDAFSVCYFIPVTMSSTSSSLVII